MIYFILKSKQVPINILVLFQGVSRNERKTKGAVIKYLSWGGGGYSVGV